MIFQSWYHLPFKLDIIIQLWLLVTFAAITSNPKISGAYSNKSLFLTYVYLGCGQATALPHGSSDSRTQVEETTLLWNTPILVAEKNKKMETHILKHGMSHTYSHPIGQNMKYDQVQSQLNETYIPSTGNTIHMAMGMEVNNFKQ